MLSIVTVCGIGERLLHIMKKRIIILYSLTLMERQQPFNYLIQMPE